MNQILYDYELKKKKLKRFKFQLFISITFFTLFLIYYFFYYINLKNGENVSEDLIHAFKIENLYGNSNPNYNVVSLNTTNNVSTIGIIEIPKIQLKYPILSTVSDELLKISPCKFYGPEPNKIGNLCIAAHNYDDNRFFGNLYKLDIGDIVYIYDFNNMYLKYYIYDKFEINSNDTSCTSQSTNGTRQITLVTCNNFNKNRLIIKAIEINL